MKGKPKDRHSLLFVLFFLFSGGANSAHTHPKDRAGLPSSLVARSKFGNSLPREDGFREDNSFGQLLQRSSFALSEGLPEMSHLLGHRVAHAVTRGKICGCALRRECEKRPCNPPLLGPLSLWPPCPAGGGAVGLSSPN